MIPFQDLLGTPYRYAGRDPETGIDCLWLLVELYRRWGVRLEVPGPGQDGDVSRQLEYFESFANAFDEIPYPGEVGDVVFVVGPELRQHIFVRVESDLFLHADDEDGVRTLRWDAVKRVKSRAYRYAGHRS